MSILYKLFQKLERERTLPNSLHNTSTTPIPKQDKDIMRKENYRLIYLENIDTKILKEMLANQMQQNINVLYTMNKRDSSKASLVLICET